MRVAGQEGIDAPANDAVAGRPAGASANGAFTALLALLQGAAGPAEIEAIADGGRMSDGAPAEAVDEPDDGSADASAADGVVVTISVASVVAVATGTTTASTSAAPGTGDTTRDGGGTTGAGAAAFGTAVADARPLAGAGARGSVTAGEGGAPGSAARAFSLQQGDGAPEAAITAGTAPPTDASAPAAGGARPGEATANVARPGEATARIAQGTLATATEAGGTPTQEAATAAGAAQPAPEDGDAAASGAHAPATRDGTPVVDGATASAAARRGAAHARAVDPAHGSGPTVARRGDAADADEAATRDGDGRAALRGSSAAAPAGDLPAAVRPRTEPAHALAHDGAAASDATARPDGLGIVRGDGLAGNAASGAERVRAAGFSTGDAGLPSWVERLSSPEGLAATRRGDALHMDLEPNGLGRIEVRLSLGRDGLRATVIAEHEHTRQLLASQQPQLAAALERNELRLESFLVDVGAHAGGDGREAWRDATDPAAFDHIGMVHVTAPDAALDDPSRASAAPRGLVSVRA